LAKETTPEAWIGWRVAVTLNVRNPDEFVARLEEVNDRGLTLMIGPGSGQEALTFYPWSSVRRLRLSEEKNRQPRKESGRRMAGDPGWFS
jgi:hypothetical protein